MAMSVCSEYPQELRTRITCLGMYVALYDSKPNLPALLFLNLRVFLHVLEQQLIMYLFSF